MRGAAPGVAPEQLRGGMKQEREDRAVGLDEIEGALQSSPGRDRVAERVAGDCLTWSQADLTRHAVAVAVLLLSEVVDRDAAYRF